MVCCFVTNTTDKLFLALPCEGDDSMTPAGALNRSSVSTINQCIHATSNAMFMDPEQTFLIKDSAVTELG